MSSEAIKFNWFDTGNPSQLAKAREQFKTNQISILPKEEEKIWFTNDKVIKFSTNKKFINNRVAKSKLLEKFVPEVIDSSENMYVYKYVCFPNMGYSLWKLVKHYIGSTPKVHGKLRQP